MDDFSSAGPDRPDRSVLIQRIENGAIAAAILTAVIVVGLPWWWLAVTFLVFDLSALGYLRSAEVGAVGYNLVHNPRAIVYNRTRGTFYGFCHQAFWNGAGRKQLTMKHGVLWERYDPLRMFRQRMTFWAMVRLGFAWLGYFGYKFFGERPASQAP